VLRYDIGNTGQMVELDRALWKARNTEQLLELLEMQYIDVCVICAIPKLRESRASRELFA
jgi:hypothetical protein